jgi:hypothetical protein
MACRLDNLQAQRVAAGHSVSRLASLSNTSDLTIIRLETKGGNGLGGTCTNTEADRICTALGISRGTAGFVELV